MASERRVVEYKGASGGWGSVRGMSSTLLNERD